MSLRQPPGSFRSLTQRGLDGISVGFWGTIVDPYHAADLIASFYLSTWGNLKPPHWWNGDPEGQIESWQIAQNAMAGKVLPNTLESIKLTFGISGVSRATTHQLVRSRVGAVFGQQGGRDNNWTGYNRREPATFEEHALWSTRLAVQNAHDQLDVLYQDLLNAGVPYQDARYVLPIGMTTNLVASYNLLALKGTLARRLCNRMMWETNHVAREMHDLAVEAYPFIGRSMRSFCERGVCGSVSPMFPPSDLYWNGEEIAPSKDNATLNEMMPMQPAMDYDWPREANATWLHYRDHDDERITEEAADDRAVYSMAMPLRKLVAKDQDGLWRKHNG